MFKILPQDMFCKVLGDIEMSSIENSNEKEAVI